MSYPFLCYMFLLVFGDKKDCNSEKQPGQYEDNICAAAHQFQ